MADFSFQRAPTGITFVLSAKAPDLIDTFWVQVVKTAMKKKFLVIPQDLERELIMATDESTFAVALSKGTVSGSPTSSGNKSGAIAELFSLGADFGGYYYSLRAAVREVQLEHPIFSSTYRRLARNAKIFGRITQIVDFLHLSRALNAPEGSIIIITPDFLSTFKYKFEILEPTDPRYREAFGRLEGAT